MLKKTGLIWGIVSILFLFSCEKKETELKIEENNTTESVQQGTQDTDIEEESKPLISVSLTDTIQIFVREDGAPGMYLGEDGEVHGFYVDLEKMVMEEMGQLYNFVSYSDVGPVAQAMKSGTHHIAISVPDLPDYRSFLNLSIPYEILNYVTFVQNGNKDISGSTRDELFKSLIGKKVGVQTQGHIYQILREIKEIELVEYPTTTKAMEDLNNGLLDAVPDVKRIGIYYATQNNWNIMPVGKPIISQNITTAFSQMLDPSLMNRYNSALKTIIDDGRRDVLYESYFGPMDEEDKP